MAAHVYDIWTKKHADGSFPYLTSTMKALLVGSGYTYTATHASLSSISSEFSGSPYSRQTLANKAITLDSGNHRSYYTSDPVTYAAINGGSAVVAVIIFADPGTGDANCIPAFYCDFSSVTPNGTDLVLTPSTSTGWATDTAA